MTCVITKGVEVKIPNQLFILAFNLMIMDYKLNSITLQRIAKLYKVDRSL